MEQKLNTDKIPIKVEPEPPITAITVLSADDDLEAAINAIEI